ncbi:hypothetical protein [Lederbergia citri]|uniref:Uncharacterized protein n=1 Tax=Lederbergia citri TaxID=2833580 RepID=A0A942TD93_9BACI|nr:hypothetical protein [Lederbergia citri]MBS4194668.1 hypothetical protein [Lederbergia citri]
MRNFEMTVSTFPEDSTNLEKEIELVKVGLLYCDKVTLKSIKADMIFRFIEYTQKTKLLDRMYSLRDISHMGLMGLHDEITQIILSYETLISRRMDNPKMIILKKQIEKQFEDIWNAMSATLDGIVQRSDIDSLDRLIKLDKLKIERYPSNAEDFYDDSHIEAYFESLKDTLSQSNNYPLLDDKITEIVKIGIKEGKIDIAKGTRERIKHSTLSLTMLEQLPSFERASINEIIDIRSELDKYLIRFRSAIVKYTDLIESDIDDDDLFYEIDKLILREINPIIQEIDEQCKGNGYLRELAYRLINSKWVQGASVGIMLGNILDVFTVTTNTISAAIPAGVQAVNHHREWKEKQSDIEKNNLFFYYQAGKELNNRYN